MTDAECAHRFPGHLPEFLPRPPDGARPLHRGAQIRFVPRDPHPDKIVVVAPRSSRAGGPWTVRRQESNFLKRTGASASSAATMSAATGAPRAMSARGRTTQITTRIHGGRARLYLR